MTPVHFLLCCSTALVLCSCAQMQAILPASEQPVVEAVQITEQKRWWQSFHDPLMDNLVQDLLTQNLDIQIAGARIAEARGAARTANSGFFPDISASASASRGNAQIGTDNPVSIALGGFDATWEIDVFGQTQALVDGAERRVESRIARAEDVTNSVIAELIRSILEYRQAEQTVTETTDLLEIQDEQVSLIAARTEAGLIDATFLSRAEAERSQTATRLPIAQAALDTAHYKIERLLGKESGELADTLKITAGELAVPEAATTLDISLESMRLRPDIRASRADLLAAQADLAKAEADLWPRISIRSFFGVQDGSGNVPIASNPIWSLASDVTAPLLNFGRLQGTIDTSDARANAASLSYQNASLTALQETKTALSDYLNGISAADEQKRALNHRKDTVSLASERFKRGLTDMTDVTTAQSELNQATLLYIERKAAAAIAYVRLHKALGTSVLGKPALTNMEMKSQTNYKKTM
jgi:outer membrane protein, multidrug efflux system